MTLYDMGRRISELVNRREQALSLLERAPNDVYVLTAIRVLSEDPFAGQEGGPSRELPRQALRKDGPLHPAHVPGRKPKVFAGPPVMAQMTQREWEVAQLVATGMTNIEVGAELGLAPRTVKDHLSRAMHRCRVHNRTQLTALVLATRVATRPA